MFETFPGAPITEAVFDIRASLHKDIYLDRLREFHKDIADRFPVIEEKRYIKAGFQLGKDEPEFHMPEKGIEGFFFKSDRENKIIQFRLNGFTFNKLKPYENWEAFFPEAQEFWKKYNEVAKPLKVERIALRYINRILAPYPIKDFSEYILTSPKIAPNLPQTLSHFFLRIITSSDDGYLTAIITETSEKPTKDQKLPIILDIDAYKQKEYAPDSQELWNDFARIREFKNQIFFNSITDKAKELFR